MRFKQPLKYRTNTLIQVCQYMYVIHHMLSVLSVLFVAQIHSWIVHVCVNFKLLFLFVHVLFCFMHAPEEKTLYWIDAECCASIWQKPQSRFSM